MCILLISMRNGEIGCIHSSHDHMFAMNSLLFQLILERDRCCGT